MKRKLIQGVELKQLLLRGMPVRMGNLADSARTWSLWSKILRNYNKRKLKKAAGGFALLRLLFDVNSAGSTETKRN